MNHSLKELKQKVKQKIEAEEHYALGYKWTSGGYVKVTNLTLDLADDIAYFDLKYGNDLDGEHHINTDCWVKLSSIGIEVSTEESP